MCGITGIINLDGHSKEEASARIKNMTDTLHHRGPDAEGFYVDDNAALGHRRDLVGRDCAAAVPLHGAGTRRRIGPVSG